MADDARNKKAPSVVWILGAGFSRSLGAPLLQDLFTRESLRRVLLAYGHDPILKQRFARAQSVITACRAGSFDPPNPDTKERQWMHAEEFLERLDQAITGKNALERQNLLAFMKTLGSAWKTSVSDGGGWLEGLRACALNLFAAECSAFVEKADLGLDRWAPYLAWVKSLQPTDTVITFNYDRVPELLSKACGGRLWIPHPEELRANGDDDKESRPALVKLHGSVNWHWDRAADRIDIRTDTAALYAEPDNLALATPGPTKRQMVKGGPLERLWTAATLAIHAAHAVVFVGYRIPPSDAYSREWLVKRLSENTRSNDGKEIRVHTVLGDDVNHPHSRRLQGIFQGMNARTEVQQWSMFAEDFLATVPRARLLP